VGVVDPEKRIVQAEVVRRPADLVDERTVSPGPEDARKPLPRAHHVDALAVRPTNPSQIREPTVPQRLRDVDGGFDVENLQRRIVVHEQPDQELYPSPHLSPRLERADDDRSRDPVLDRPVRCPGEAGRRFSPGWHRHGAGAGREPVDSGSHVSGRGSSAVVTQPAREISSSTTCRSRAMNRS
jgi:hypothetical protein